MESLYEVRHKLRIQEHTTLEDILPKLDIIYVTRIQRERFPDLQEYENVKGSYVIDTDVLKNAKSDVSIMHPMPRMDEISQSIDNTVNAIYFKQAAYGKDLRSALLAMILNESIF
jgi:aspartate carbamoyltransferase catalytic subunit